MSKQLEFDFGEEFKNRDKIVEVFISGAKTRQEKARAKALLKNPETRKIIKELLNV